MDKIILSDCRFRIHLGVTKEEQSKLQTIHLDLEIFLDLVKAGRSDDLTDTINYSAVYDTIADHLSPRSFNLIEAVAEQLTTLLLKKFPFKTILLRVKKPSALKKKNVAWARVEITRP